MKYLLVLLVVLVAFWIWRNNRVGRDTPEPPARAPQPGPKPPLAMVACRHCGMHLPEGEALVGRHGHYCSDEHRRLQDD
ncbi:MAG TPA: PP0621 family protein [Hydrogenophaga sp.]|uniref:PP0621 family protein n=1 Tax=Hydrogenophaga sp. TaxID=1904254 RepID=UPI002BF3E3F5|nr:PP0621 family protein [Hydrogenophaga sp.]HMN94508.1 PP0621 family protein [Hydrogenophaga sp.]HMP11299.1 PP0621 family protein [Hydrogenophaga sp.]